MNRERVHYLVSAKNAHHGAAIARGFKARTVPAERRTLEKGALHIIGGLQHGSLELMQQVLDAGEPYVFIDRAYFGGGPGSNCLRVVPGAYQHHWRTRCPSDRWEALCARERGTVNGVSSSSQPAALHRVVRSRARTCAGTSIETPDSLPHPSSLGMRPWRMQGAHVLVVPPSEAICKLFHIEAQMAGLEARVRSAFDGPVIVSRKGDPRPLNDRLANCWAVVTWTSNVAVEAILAGVPVFCSHYSAAAPVSLTLDQIEQRIERPYLADDREAWAAALAYGQFDLEEIASGYAAEIALADFQ
jgi:hypothetical protein